MTTRKEVRKIFNEVKKAASLNFALTAGECCSSCTWESIASKYGENARGIWLKWFNRGMNRAEWDGEGKHYISHDLTDEQKTIVYNILRKYFIVEWNFSDGSCIKIYL